MAGMDSILRKVLLSFQLCLGFWQIVKLTGFAAILKAFWSWCLSRLGTLFSSPYSRLRKFDDGPYFGKYGECLVTKEGDQATVANQVSPETVIKITYLGSEIHLERRGDKLLVDRKMQYYITDPIWHSLLSLQTVGPQTVFLKGHKVLFTGLIIGGVMELSEVLDGLILRNETIKSLSDGGVSLFHPINLSISEEKLLKALNLVGLFLQAKKEVYWLIPTLLSFTSAVLEFSTPLRVWMYRKVNIIFCCIMHAFCDRLPLRARMWIYSLLDWVENLKPSNDIKWRVVRDVEYAVIGGGAKAQLESASEIIDPVRVDVSSLTRDFSCGPWKVELTFDAKSRRGRTKRFRFAKQREYFEVVCDEDEKYSRLRTFIECLVENCSGSLESCEGNNRVCRVRSFKDSVLCYVKNGFPRVYRLKLEKGVVK